MTGRAALEAALGHRFGDGSALAQALTHRSFGSPHYERLEFLGDSILGLVISAEIYARYPGLREGEMSRLRAQLVREETLRDVATGIDLGRHLRLGEGESRSGGQSRASILADALEALIGAVFLDAGYDAARAVVLRLFGALLDAPPAMVSGKDPKTRLQEVLQGRHLPLPAYAIVGTHGAAHEQTFEVECEVASLGIRTRGAGASRRLAEQDAATRALALIEEPDR